MQNHQLNSGNTSLHLIALTGTSIDLLKYNTNQAQKDAITPNNQGKLPWDLIAQNKAPEEEKEKMRTAIKNMLPKEYCPPMKEKAMLSKKLAEEKGSNKFFINPRYAFYQLCLKAANYARENIWFSSSHPDANQLERKEHDALRNFIDLQRENADTNYVFRKQAPPFYDTAVKKSKKGNCYEFAMLVAHFLKIHAHQIKLADIHMHLAQSDDGDHDFIILTAGDVTALEQKGLPKNTVLAIDAWTGILYHPSEIQHLKMHRKLLHKDGSITNVLVPFNENCHTIHLYPFGKLSPDVIPTPSIRSKL